MERPNWEENTMTPIMHLPFPEEQQNKYFWEQIKAASNDYAIYNRLEERDGVYGFGVYKFEDDGHRQKYYDYWNEDMPKTSVAEHNTDYWKDEDETSNLSYKDKNRAFHKGALK